MEQSFIQIILNKIHQEIEQIRKMRAEAGYKSNPDIETPFGTDMNHSVKKYNARRAFFKGQQVRFHRTMHK